MIYLVGFMGVGKSLISKVLAKQYDCNYLDTDNQIEKEENLSVTQIFQKYGEEHFRKLEREVLLRNKTSKIVSCGGGLPLFNNNMEYILKSGKSIYLKASTETLINRLKKDTENRPLINKLNAEELKAYIEKNIPTREYYYKKANFIIETDGLTTQEVLREINSLPIAF